MTGSETFIMVALRCSESSTPVFLASSIWSAKNFRSALTLIFVVSMTSPASSEAFFLRTVTFPAASTNSMR
jgi:hypothetical protein